MKKYYLFSAILLLAAACNSSIGNKSAPNQSNQNQQLGNQNSYGSMTTYTNSQYRFTLPYAENTQFSVYDSSGNLISGPGDKQFMGGTDLTFFDLKNFKWSLSDGVSEETLHYDQNNSTWVISLGINQPASQAFCPNILRTKSQQLPYYQIGDFRTGRNWDFAYVTKKGIIILSVGDGELPDRTDPTHPYVLDPALIKFNNPNDVISVGCNSNSSQRNNDKQKVETIIDKIVTTTKNSFDSNIKLNTYTNTAFGYQFNYPDGFTSISAANRDNTKPLITETTYLNNLVVGTSKNQDVLQILVLGSELDKNGQNINDTTGINNRDFYNSPLDTYINGIGFQKYTSTKAGYEYNQVLETYLAGNGKNWFLLNVFDPEGDKILQTFKFTK